jgi:hypothetical protein
MRASCASLISGVRSPEDTIPSDRNPSVHDGGDELARDTDLTPSARESFPTVPYQRASVSAILSLTKQLEQADEESPESGRAQPEWCVEVGQALRALTTFELWMAIARGELGAETHVWRDGMEGWTPIANVPELAYALVDATTFEADRATPEPVTPLLHADLRTPLTFEAANVAQTDPPEAEERRATILPEPLVAARRLRPLRAINGGLSPLRRNVLSMLAGCAVAVTAVSLALVRTAGGPQDTAVAANVQNESDAVAMLKARLGEVAAQAGSNVVEGPVRRASVIVAPPPPVARHHSELGQHRARRSARH